MSLDQLAHDWRCVCGETRHTSERVDNTECPWHHPPAHVPLVVDVAMAMQYRYRGDRVKQAAAYAEAFACQLEKLEGEEVYQAAARLLRASARGEE